METLILDSEKGIELGAKLIQAGEVVAFPTETVYGLGGNALDPSCVAKIYAAKGRPADNPLIVHISKVDDIYPLVAEFSESNKKLVERFMPGPITLLFPKSDIVPDSVTAGLKTVGIRMPKSEIARKFIEACGVPIAAPSANASTRVSPTTAKHVYEDMNGRIPLIIDGGDSEVGIESTVLDLTGEIPTILRPGAITPEMLADVVGSVKTHKGEVISSAPAPGMKYKHYAPTVPMVVAKDMKSLVEDYDKKVAKNMNPLCLIRGQAVQAVGDRRYVNLGNTDAEVCRNIYRVMRDSEKVCDSIICIDLGESGVCKSVMNRVLKASGGKVV